MLTSSRPEAEKAPGAPVAAAPTSAAPSPVMLPAAQVPASGQASTEIPRVGDKAQPEADLVRALAQFGITLAETPQPPHVGPSVIRHRVLLAPGVRLDSLRKREEDIGRALGQEVAVINLPGEPYVAIDLPRRPRQIVSLLSAIDTLPAAQSKAELWVPFGVTPSAP